MATYTPPPYFPQGSLAPPDKKRYRKFKLLMIGLALLLILLVGAAGYGIWYLIRVISG
jgi:nitrate reductase NapE component